jgi:cytochrome c oxidase subunit IV
MTEHAPHSSAHMAPEHHAGGAAADPLLEHGEHGGHGEHGHDNSPEAVAREKRKYLIIFGCLAVLTGVTVGVSYLDLPTWQAIALALLVATVKGSLVAAFFMHLLSERRLIYAVLLLTVFFFGVLMWGPWHHRHDAENEYPGYDVNAGKPAKPQTTPAHSGH